MKINKGILIIEPHEILMVNIEKKRKYINENYPRMSHNVWRTIKNDEALDVVIENAEFKFNHLITNYRNITHEKIKHSLGQYVDKHIHTNTIEGYWSLFKRMFVGTYHSMRQKHLNKYLNALAFRYNNIGLNSNNIFKLFLSKCQGKLNYRELTK